ncbi:TPA: DUF2513 domain-containing protein [Bacillus thuringiensis]|uniref:DUF2513 domain-containing protein n=1 Tax=Bacillus thuringiensis serovar iberica TaxID=180866 RepID=A0A9X6LFP6_BACTU|nr:DUF2513 domain-containing protein [Bacillus thuringiensis]MEB9625675.1 DUF2513 domain-containing protein [Bacillus cereus]OUB44960.1 hypothetical protein BK741_21490 [Bacillus thuringiensis serovar iberica]HDR5353844.1 DUF2513 domain-containing protein [Bacillus thuringiensis]
MKLNQDCIRSILLELEEKLNLGQHIHLHQLKEFKAFNEYGENESVYAILKLIEAGYLNGAYQFDGDEIYALGIASITFSGHEFLDTIRDSKVWAKTKTLTQKLTSVPINVLSAVAVKVTKDYIGLS